MCDTGDYSDEVFNHTCDRVAPGAPCTLTCAPGYYVDNVWQPNAAQHCGGGDWGANLEARTVASLDACKASCIGSSTCVGVAVGSYGGVDDNCILCTNSNLTSDSTWHTYMKWQYNAGKHCDSGDWPGASASASASA